MNSTKVISGCVDAIKIFNALRELDDNNDFWNNRLGRFDKQFCFRDHYGLENSVSDIVKWYNNNCKYFNKKKLKQILTEYNKKENDYAV